MNANDILIIGDSFAQARGPGSWPYILTERLTGRSGGEPRGRGYCGCSWWIVRDYLLKELACPPKVLILVHTEPYRLPDAHGYGMSMKWSPFKSWYTDNIYSKEQLKQKGLALQQYYEQLFIPEYHEWAQLAWFREVDTIIAQCQIPHVVHMMIHPHFPQRTYEFATGITVEERLQNHHDKREQYLNTNHYTPEGNQIKAQCLHRLIASTEPYDSGLHGLKLSENGLPVVNVHK